MPPKPSDPHPKAEPLVFEPQKKPTLILIHGFRGSPLGLESIRQYLAKAGFDVHVPPIPPFGGASPLETYTPKSYAKYIADYIRKHDLHRPVLIGHSMGSIVAAATAKFYPDLISRQLILMSPISTKPNKPIAVISPLSALAPRRAVDYTTTRFLFVPHNRQLFRETLHATNACSNDRPPERSDVAAAAHFSAHNSISDFALTQNILLLAGNRDRLISPRKTIQLAKQLHADLVFIPHCGHLHIYEKPLETAQAIIDFLDKPQN